MEQKLFDALREMGLTDGEIKVYVALTSIGTSTVGPIIDKSGVSASKVYIILDKLQSKGLASMIIQNRNKIFKASTPESLVNYLDEQKLQIENTKKKVESLIPVLKLKYDSDKNLPIAEFARGPKGFETFHEESLAAAKKGDRYLAIASTTFSFRMKHFWFNHSQKMTEKGIEQFLVYEHTAWYKKDPNVHQRHKRRLYYPRVLSEDNEDLVHINVLGDCAIISDIEGDDIFCLLIRNKRLTKSFAKLIALTWNSAKIPEGFPTKELKIT